jgi:hypothetical protein
MKSFYSALILLLLTIPAAAQQTITSRRSGDWSSAASWDLNRVPGDNDIVVIQRDHVLAMSRSVNLKNITLRVIGELGLGRGQKLTLNSGSVVSVISGGKILADKADDGSAILLGGAVKFRGGRVFNQAWGPGVLVGLAYATSTTGNIDQFGAGFIIGSLPSVWQDLKLYITSDNHVQMVWVTSHETASRSFRIERSRQGADWTEIGQIKSAGNMSSQNIYNFVDNFPGSGKVYYRVREIDPDGVVKLSSVRSVRLDATVNPAIYPNPASGMIQVTHKKVEREARLTMYDMLGHTVHTQVLPEGTTTQTMDISKLPTGVYAIRVTHEDGSFNDYRLVKH